MDRSGDRNGRGRAVLVTGGAGYVGSALVPRLLQLGCEVRVLDLYLFGDTLQALRGHARLREYKGDVRDLRILGEALEGADSVIHLACISNDPSVELDPALSRSINLDSFRPLVRLCKQNRVRRFIFASSAGVYGLSSDPDVTEAHPHRPITDYNRYKSQCESVLWEERGGGLAAVSIRPATVCGYAPRMRLDLVVNILTHQAVNLGRMTVFGGEQMRPTIHIDDMVDLYCRLLEVPKEKMDGEAFNAGCENSRVRDLAVRVRAVVKREMPELGEIPIEASPTDDGRSYRISSEKARRVLGFSPKKSVEDAALEMIRAFRDGRVPDPVNDMRYYNVRLMKALGLR